MHHELAEDCLEALGNLSCVRDIPSWISDTAALAEKGEGHAVKQQHSAA